MSDLALTPSVDNSVYLNGGWRSRYSSDGYAFGLLASGHVDIVVTAGQQPYDFLPLVNVVEQAGGCISDWKGKALGLDSDGRILASADHRLHEQALSAVQT